MNSTEPSMFTQAIRHGNDAGSNRRNRPDTARMPKPLATRNSVDPKKSGRQTRRSSLAVAL